MLVPLLRITTVTRYLHLNKPHGKQCPQEAGRPEHEEVEIIIQHPQPLEVPAFQAEGLTEVVVMVTEEVTGGKEGVALPVYEEEGPKGEEVS